MTAADIGAVQALSAAAVELELAGSNRVLWPGTTADWTAALRRDGAGLLVWRDGSGELVAYAACRRYGEQGVITAAAIHPAWHGRDVAARIVEEATRWLQLHGSKTIGLEVDARDTDLLGAWIRLGAYPTTVTLPLVRVGKTGATTAPDSDWDCAPACRALVEDLSPGLDIGPDLQRPEDGSRDGLLVIPGSDGPDAFALYRATPVAPAGSTPTEMCSVRILAAAHPTAFDALITKLRDVASTLPDGGLLLRSEPCGWATQTLLGSRFAPVSPDLRLALVSAPRAPASTGVLWVTWQL
jgi:GNAT superfamily N-acetyltransferase